MINESYIAEQLFNPKKGTPLEGSKTQLVNLPQPALFIPAPWPQTPFVNSPKASDIQSSSSQAREYLPPLPPPLPPNPVPNNIRNCYILINKAYMDGKLSYPTKGTPFDWSKTPLLNSPETPRY